MRFVVKPSVHGLPSVQVHGDPALAEKVANAVRDNWTPSPAYQARVGSGAFLQGFDATDGWCLVEFWEPHYHTFVEYLNTLEAE